jgi:hypothetical protein
MNVRERVQNEDENERYLDLVCRAVPYFNLQSAAFAFYEVAKSNAVVSCAASGVGTVGASRGFVYS